LKIIINDGDKMKMTNISVISLLLLSLIVVGLTNAQYTNSTTTPIVGSPNSIFCSIYKSLNLQVYEMPLILTFVGGGAVVIAYEAFKRMALQKEEKEGVADADLSQVMSRTYTTIILVIIIVAAVVIILSIAPLIAC